MFSSGPKPRRIQWWGRRAIAAGLVCLLPGMAALCLTVEHKPGWYRPAVLDEHGLERARSEATAAWDQISGRVVQGRPFDVVLTDRVVNEWLAALDHHRPEVLQSLSPQLRAPAVRFLEGDVRVGAHYEANGWRAIVTVAAAPRISPDGRLCQLELTGAYVGSLPVPKALIQTSKRRNVEASKPTKIKEMNPSLFGRLDISTFRRFLPEIANRFVWPNGDRPFRIDSIMVRDGELHLRVIPL